MRHIAAIHINLTPYQCQECKKYYGVKSTLQRHIKIVHKKPNQINVNNAKKHFD